MFATLKMDWPMINYETKKVEVVLAGRHELAKIANPFGKDGPWLIIKGTNIGMLESDWLTWQNGICLDPLNPFCGEYKDWQEREIVIEE